MAKNRESVVDKQDRVGDLAREIFVSLVIANPTLTAAKHAQDAFSKARDFFAVADKQEESNG